MVLTNFNFPKHHWSNITVNRKFKRSNITAYRGESRHSGTNMARYGQGIYSTQRRSYAAKFGTVRTVLVDELPWNPFRVRTITDFEFLEGEYRRQYVEAGGSMDAFYQEEGVIGYLKHLGYDGLTVGIAPDNIIVKWIDVR